MKNTLAENMLRFGVKNLHELDVKKIQESLLTEATDLMPKLGKEFTANMIATLKKHPGKVRFYFGNGLYYVEGRQDLSNEWTDDPNDIDLQVPFNGGFTTLTTVNAPGIGIVPIVPDPITPDGGAQFGEFQWDGRAAKLMSLTYTPIESKLFAKTAQESLAGLKNLAGDISSVVYSQLYAASPNKTAVDQAIAALKTKPVEIRKALPYALTKGLGIPTA